MSRDVFKTLVLAVGLAVATVGANAQPTPGGKMADANRQRLLIDDMEDVSDWTNGSPVETILSASTKHVKQGRAALEFANRVDHTKGEKNYPVGWPRTRKNLAKPGLSDWSEYDFFECWIFVETSRESLPIAGPLPAGDYRARLTLYDEKHNAIDQREVDFKVIQGPFSKGTRP